MHDQILKPSFSKHLNQFEIDLLKKIYKNSDTVRNDFNKMMQAYLAINIDIQNNGTNLTNNEEKVTSRNIETC